jgi:methionyl-tRNA synthetase
MSIPKRYLVTSALPYANGPLHIGHLAGAYLPADIYVRYLRLMGRDVVYVCGSDEHGAAITVKARKENTTPQAVVDQYHASLRDTFKGIGISFDIYHRTTAAIHYETSQGFFRQLLKNEQFDEITGDQYYDETVGQFLADRYIMGTCPNCANPEAYGDQCEKCGTSLNPTDLINPRSTLSGSTPVKRPTRHWFLKLNEHENWLREWINTGKNPEGEVVHAPAEWKNHVIGQCNSWLDSGLQPRAMTRDLDWGIPVPPEVPGSENKVLYVWLDAPIGYISATKQWALDNGKAWEPYWQDKDTALIHFIGKDNIVFHCLIFPAILKAHGGFILPVNVPANQFLNLEGRKLSTSKNWAVWVHEFLEELPGQGDALRFNMIKKMPEQSDSEFTWKGYQETTNNELVNNLANFVNRVLVLTHKYYAGVVPEIATSFSFKSGWEVGADGQYDAELAQLLAKIQELTAQIEAFNFRDALRLLMEISSAGNAILQFNEPWKAVKENPELVKVVMNIGLQIVAALSVLSRPFMPEAAERLRTMLNLPAFRDQGELEALLEQLGAGQSLLPAGHTIGEAAHLFNRVPDDVIDIQIAKLHQNDPVTQQSEIPKPATSNPETNNLVTQQPATLKPMIQYDDFAKIDIRTGTILTAEKMEKSKKLLKLSVDLGSEQRTILSGIAEHFTPEEVVGQQVIVLANLAPRAMMGTESQGMILMADSGDGKLSFVSPTDGWANGMEVR